MNEVDNFSKPVIFLEVYGKETGILAGSATGFLLQAGTRVLLVTNWHIVAGRHSWNHEELSFNGATPDHFKAYFRVARRGEIVNASVDVPIRVVDIPQWIEHKDRKLPIVPHSSKFAIDVAIIDVTRLVPQKIVGTLPWNGLSHFHLYPAELISIIGYPFGLFGRDIYPIWISGTVANDRPSSGAELENDLINNRSQRFGPFKSRGTEAASLAQCRSPILVFLKNLVPGAALAIGDSRTVSVLLGNFVIRDDKLPVPGRLG